MAMSQIAFGSRCRPLVMAAILFTTMAATTSVACAQEVVLLGTMVYRSASLSSKISSTRLLITCWRLGDLCVLISMNFSR